MGNRRKTRELAVQALFFMDMSGGFSKGSGDLFITSFEPPRESVVFFEKLVHGVLGSKKRIDRIIEAFSNNWKISRMSCVDRNIMRIAVFELLFLTEIPPKVSINEAIDIGKKYGTAESGAFINGILDSVNIARDDDEISGILEEIDEDEDYDEDIEKSRAEKMRIAEELRDAEKVIEEEVVDTGKAKVRKRIKGKAII